jgi:hypothetical protein
MKTAAMCDLLTSDPGTVPAPLYAAAGGRYTWFVSSSTNYLEFGPTENVNFDLVLETVD